MRWAAREAAMRHEPLSIVHVLPALPVAASALAWPAGRVPEEVLEIQESEGRGFIADATRTARESVGDKELDVAGELFIGAPVQALSELSTDAKMLVVASQGRSKRHRPLLGSVSTGVLYHARCSVAVIHEEAESPQRAHLPVLVGIDGSAVSESAIAIAFDEASWRSVDLLALHVWSDADMPWLPSLETSAQQRVAEETLAERLAGWQEKYPDVTVRRIVRYDRPAQQLLEESGRAQLVVVGNRGRGGFAGMLLGSVSAAVSREARIPVIVARQR
ncbi:universal stress protein UspA [Mycolicibacterium wolinskyi]|uniref:Universal stress protein UspA n=1 Tax=Mycolicibacterium wolinskyi TaxID=59750 RepID=A0A132PJR0_9MYCO|nr:universal stress protein UspA [Mycolicibacterium wolinskyi]